MKKINTGSKLIHRYDGALSAQSCRQLSAYLKDRKANNTPTFYDGRLPWNDNDSYSLKLVERADFRKAILDYASMLAKKIERLHEIPVYPTFLDLVLWRPGREMPFHKDNGDTPSTRAMLQMRKFSSVTYLNSGFKGGETVIRHPDGFEYVSRPKVGSAVIFSSDERCMHRVEAIRSGLRTTLAIWFTDDPRFEWRG